MAAGSRAVTAEEISRNIQTNRNITISIENNSDFSLTNPRIYTFSGYNLDPPQPTIKKETTAVCSFSKTWDTACGSVGVLTYDVFNNNNAVECIAMMFSVPFDYNLYENWFAIGSFSVGTYCDNALYNRMYHKGEDGFSRKKATHGFIEFTGKAVEIKATMSPIGRSIMKIEVWNKPLCAVQQCGVVVSALVS
ncbi:DELTA-stichotoxin-Hcr4a-like [Acipenser ruthenus]|uniref:DELTA-stichotoxin-Hcr4a-like n=1 Tax=Acipenser ruthenus TaxID=7906 RepID=UPI0027403567|nr:DELTA-stichotoxin-Hcr4a-like [Acipenser ruthenus]XP_058863423.1 DELTA-stichotoxin-Hcr4a-like [Acipenser ruthenus]